MKPVANTHYLFDWGDTLMVDIPNQTGPMCDWPNIELVDGAKACLLALSKQASCHLATNAQDSDERAIRRALQRAELDESLDKVFCKVNLGVGKEDPSYFLRIVAKLGVNTCDVTMVGDNLENDILPALKAGLQAVWLNPKQRKIPANVRSIRCLEELIQEK